MNNVTNNKLFQLYICTYCKKNLPFVNFTFFVIDVLLYCSPNVALFQVSGQVIEVKTPLTHRDHSNLLSQMDKLHNPVFKIRRCFLYQNQYFQLDIYKEPCHQRCKVFSDDNGRLLIE